jgi:hypothetical protein
MLPLLALKALAARLAAEGLGLLGGAVLAKGKDAIEQKLGVDLEQSLGTVDGRIQLQRLQADREEDLHAFILAKRQQWFDARKVEQADTDSARSMNVRINESPNAGWLPKNIVALLALIVLLGGGALLWSTEEPEVRTAVVGLMTLVLGFFFGSSRGSQAKDATIAALGRVRE